jgi:hypothetical protein
MVFPPLNVSEKGWQCPALHVPCPQPRPHAPQLVASFAFRSTQALVPQVEDPEGHWTVTLAVVVAEAPLAGSMTVTVTVTKPGLEYVCPPPIAKAVGLPVIVPGEDVPSPQSTSALSAPAVSLVTASINAATEPENAVPAIGVMETAVAVSCTWQAPATHVCPVAQANAVPHPPQLALFACMLIHAPLHSVGVCPPHVERQA